MSNPLSEHRSSWNIAWVNAAREVPNELWARCFSPPLEGRWWYRSLEEAGLEDQFTFAYAILKKDGQPTGLAPTFVFDVPIDLIAPPLVTKLLRMAGPLAKRLRYQRTLFVGSPWSDEGTLGLSDSADLPGAIAALQGELVIRAKVAGAPMIVWKDFPDELTAAFAPMVEAGKLFRAVSYPGTRVRLPGPGFDAYLKTLNGEHRHKLKKKLKRSLEMGPLDVSVGCQPSAEALEEIFALFWQTYKRGKTKFEVLNRAFFARIAAHDGAHFVQLRDPATGRLVAFMLCFHIGPRVINKFIGLDYAYGGNWYLYFRLWQAAVEWASSLGVHDFQSGQTGYHAKLDVGCSLVPLTNYCRHRNPLMNALFARIARGIGWLTIDSDLAVWCKAHPDLIHDTHHHG